jgi:predicted metalloprotease with PDZ domain
MARSLPLTRSQGAHPVADPLRYAVDLSHRLQHLVGVTLQVPDDLPRPVRLVMPTWTAGSYVMRDYVHHVQSITARDGEGRDLALTPDGHTAWLLETDANGVEVSWELYANELTVRTNHVDDHHALLVGPATFVVIPDARDRRHQVSVHSDTPVWSLLPEAGDGAYVADDMDHLLDAAFESGQFPHVEVDVDGIPHRFVWSGHGGAPTMDRIADDMEAIARASADLFEGDLPIDDYTFLCVGWDSGGGGLEHRDGAVLMMPVTTFQDTDTYAKFQTLVAHEYLHLWNVKRLVPAELVRPDPAAHAHTRLLWVAEGWTAYYDELLPLRGGVWSVDRYLTTAGEQLDRVWGRPGVGFQSVEEASHQAWTKQYIRDENSDNAGTDYYSHGAVLAWCLDLLIRRHRPDGDGLDDAFRSLWREFGGTGSGFTDADVRAAVAEAAGTDLGWFFDAHVAGRDLPDLADLVGVVGLELTRPDPDTPTPWLGVATTEDDRGVTLAAALRDGPAWQAGITGGDRLVAINGQTVARGKLDMVLRAHEAGDTVTLTVSRGPRVLDLDVTLADPQRSRRLTPVSDPTAEQQATFHRWTGHDLPTS